MNDAEKETMTASPDPNQRHLTRHDVTTYPLCNGCGLTTALPDYDGPKGQVEYEAGLIRAMADGGFSSTPGNGWGALDDTTHYVFSLCEFCCDALMATFVIPPVVRGNFGNDPPEPFRPASDRVREDAWRKGHRAAFEQESAKRAALRRFGR